MRERDEKDVWGDEQLERIKAETEEEQEVGAVKAKLIPTTSKEGIGDYGRRDRR